MAQIRVAVVGAGAAGLAMSRYLVNEPHIDFITYERASEIGGVWRYTKDGGQAANEQDITAMYKNLRTNLPKEVMAYPDVPFPQDLPSFVTNADVKEYLETYAELFNFRKYIKFNHEVLSIKPILSKKETEMWDVVVKDLTSKKVQKNVFDAVVVCNGHFSDPRFPEIPGLDIFPGKVIHSQKYNKPDDFQDQQVIVLGAGSSGLDIAMELSNFSKKVFLVHLRSKLPAEFPENIAEVTGTLTACFEDGSVEINHAQILQNVNAIVMCTGYHFSFPFLEPECEILVSNNRVTSLYKHIFSTKFPSLSFVGLCLRICPFPTFAIQAQCVASVLTGRAILPNEDEMIKDEELDYQKRLQSGVQQNMMHSLGPERQMEYCKTIAEIAGMPCDLSLPVQSLYSHVNKIRLSNLASYKNMNFAISDDDWYTVKSSNS